MSEPCKATRHDVLTVWFLGEPQKPRLVGALRLTENKGVALTYAPVWLENGFALSEDLPLVGTTLRPR